MAFADDMTIRDLTDEEIKECAGDPTLVVAMKALARFKQLEREGKL